MIAIAPLEKFGCLTFTSRVEVRNMIADSSEPYKVRNKKHGEERHHPKLSKSQSSRLSYFFRKKKKKKKKCNRKVQV